MSVITKITYQRDKTRVNLFVDGKFYCGISLVTMMQHKIREGDETDIARLEELITESEKNAAFDRALKYISARLKTESELREYLKKKHYLESIIDYCIEKLKSYNYIDDGYYAERFAEKGIKSGGKAKIKYELRRKNVSEEYIQKSLESVTEEDERASAQAIADKYMRNKESNKENRAKLYRYLYSKGFSYDIIGQVVRENDDD